LAWNFESPIKKLTTKFREESEGTFSLTFSNILYQFCPLLLFWRLKISNGFLEMNYYFDFTTFLVQSFLGKSYSTMPKWNFEFYFEQNSYVLTMICQAFIFEVSYTLWGFIMDNAFHNKNALSPPLILIIYQWSIGNSIILSSMKTFLDGWWSNDRSASVEVNIHE